jgi:hypothetical protein
LSACRRSDRADLGDRARARACCLTARAPERACSVYDRVAAARARQYRDGRIRHAASDLRNVACTVDTVVSCDRLDTCKACARRERRERRLVDELSDRTRQLGLTRARLRRSRARDRPWRNRSQRRCRRNQLARKLTRPDPCLSCGATADLIARTRQDRRRAPGEEANAPLLYTPVLQEKRSPFSSLAFCGVLLASLAIKSRFLARAPATSHRRNCAGQFAP